MPEAPAEREIAEIELDTHLTLVDENDQVALDPLAIEQELLDDEP